MSCELAHHGLRARHFAQQREEQARQTSRQEIVHSITEADILTSKLTDLLIEKVYVFPDNHIEIVYKVHDLFE